MWLPEEFQEQETNTRSGHSLSPKLPSPQRTGTLRKGWLWGASSRELHVQGWARQAELSNLPSKGPERLSIGPLPSVPLWYFLKQHLRNIIPSFCLLPIPLSNFRAGFQEYFYSQPHDHNKEEMSEGG